MKLSRNPTGIESFDPVMHGGLPSGSLVLLLSEIGAGDFEYAITSIGNLLGPKKSDNGVLSPKKVHYISITRSKDDILREVEFSFPIFHEILKNNMEFKDFSEAYYASSFIPASWRSSSNTEFSLESLKWGEKEGNLIAGLIEYLDNNASDSIVIIDSLTVLAQYCLERMLWKDMIMFLRGIQKASKRWNGIIYTILSQGIFERSKEEEISECVDGVMVFEWEKSGLSRQRIMYLKKFRGTMPVLDQDNIVNFEIKISSQRGFEVSNIKRVRGR